MNAGEGQAVSAPLPRLHVPRSGRGRGGGAGPPRPRGEPSRAL